MTLRSWTILNSFLVIVIYRYYFGRSTTTLHEIFDYHWGQRYVMVRNLHNVVTGKRDAHGVVMKKNHNQYCKHH